MPEKSQQKDFYKIAPKLDSIQGKPGIFKMKPQKSTYLTQTQVNHKK